MYARRVGERTLTFQVSGYLWRRSLVMRDMQTETMWSHLLGRGMRGELEGEELETIPSVMVTWEKWRERHPDTSVLAMSRTVNRYRERAWANPGRFVYGIALGPSRPAPAVALERLRRDRVVPVETQGVDMVVTHAEGGAVRAFRASVNGRELDFESSAPGRMTDEQTGSEWDVATGEALSGPMQGRRLDPVNGTISYGAAWNAFHPDEPVVE